MRSPLPSESSALVWDILRRAGSSTLEASGQTLWTIVFGVLCAAGVWYRQCRRENRSFWSFPEGWKDSTLDTVLVTAVVLAIIFVPKLIGAIQDRDGEQQATIRSLRQAAEKKPSSDGALATALADRDREITDLKLKIVAKDNEAAELNRRIRELETRVEDERRRADALQQKLGAATAQQTQCDKLATLSQQGRALVTKLRATRAAPDTRLEIDDWYKAVCGAMSKSQCEAFLSAPPAQGNWIGYPVEDGGYSQALRGRSEYLSMRLSEACR